MTVNNSTCVSGNPDGATTTSTFDTAGPANDALNKPASILSLVVGCTMCTFGADRYPPPPLVTVTTPIVFEFSTTIKGEINAFGFKVLSDEYSNPSLIILTWFALPIDFEEGITYAPVPEVLSIPLKLGNLLYPVPLKLISAL